MEEVVRLDERVAFRLADYRLADGAALAIGAEDVAGLPGIALDLDDGDGPVWLAAERIARRAPPPPPAALSPWLVPGADPAVGPRVLPERVETVGAVERLDHVHVARSNRSSDMNVIDSSKREHDVVRKPVPTFRHHALALLAAERAGEADFPPLSEAGADGAARFARTLRLADLPEVAAAIDEWVAGPWRAWAVEEAPRRRAIALYGRLYKLQQLLELGGPDGAVEAVWGIGPVRWTREGRAIDRPFIERLVELELEPSGRILLRPRDAEARVDLKPYEAFDCPNLGALDEAVRRDIARAGEDEGVVPFRPETFEPILNAAATRLAPNGRYARHREDAGPPHDGPSISGGWVLFARPRSRHVALDDIARFRALARGGAAVEGLAARLVTPPSDAAGAAGQALGATLGGTPDAPAPGPEDSAPTDVFFPKPFNDDQVAIVRRLAKADGLVVQGPPGTGKTHTIANLICHAMALGQSVLVVSRGEAALSVLREQLPDKVRPLTIALLASERQGMRQVEAAIREIQAVVEESRPDIRLSAIRRCEAEIVKIRDRVAAIDAELDAMAARQGAPIGPRAERPADLARRLDAARDAFAWFTDRPAAFADESGITDEDVAALGAARREAGDLIDHVDAALPPREALPDARTVVGWHEDLSRARRLAAAQGPAPGLPVTPGGIAAAERCATALRGFAAAFEDAARVAWAAPLLRAAMRGEASPWIPVLEGIAAAWEAVEAERVRLAPFAVEAPDACLEDDTVRAAIRRASAGERPWSRLSIGRSAAKDRVAAIRVRGLPPGGDTELWRAVAAHMALRDDRVAVEARWRTFAAESSGVTGGDRDALGPVAEALIWLKRLRAALGARADMPPLADIAPDPPRARDLAASLESAVLAARLAAADAPRARAALAFSGGDRTSVSGRQFFDHLVGREDVAPERLDAVFTSLLERIEAVRARAPAFAVIRRHREGIAAAGAPGWAARLAGEPAGAQGDALLPAEWRQAWDHGAAAARLGLIDGRETLAGLSREREALERRGRKLFVELVRERAFHTLERRLSPRVKSALVEYVRALSRLGKGTGKGAGRNRRAARDAMARCYGAIPCWIMPTWRVAELLPASLAAFDLVILDEASQSDVTELPALLRGRKILAVGDDRQISPTPPFVSLAKIEHLRRRYLEDLPFASLLEPGESLYDLMRAVFPDSRLMLKEHFRCVEPIIRFSMQFYPEKLVPLRVPAAHERMDPPLVDIHVPHGRRDGARKINRAEAAVIVEEVAALAADPARAAHSIGVISLIGGEQAELIRVLLAERIGEEAMQRHRILCGDSAAFQGNERDIVFLSLVADRERRSTLTMPRYEQRFNVAASRARDRLVLVRSVAPEDLNPKDLKARLIAHFQDPSPSRAPPSGDASALCDSDFERDVMRALVRRGYAVEPQVGAEGFRIDLVVEGLEGRRLAVECDGDRFHGPERWREDMRRQRILERVGWRFWRCFASNYYRDPEGSLADLVAALEAQGIEPTAPQGSEAPRRRLVEHRVAAPPPSPIEPPPARPAGRLGAGDTVVLLFEDRKRETYRLTGGADAGAGGLVGLATPLGALLAAAEEGEEIEVPRGAGPAARAMVESVTRAG